MSTIAYRVHMKNTPAWYVTADFLKITILVL